MVFVLLGITFVFVLLFFEQSHKSLISPGMLFVVPFAIAVLFSLFNYSNWGLASFSFETLLTITLGLLLFLIGTTLFDNISFKNTFSKSFCSLFYLSSLKLLFSLLIILVGSSLNLIFMIKWGNERGLNLIEAVNLSMYNSKFSTGEASLDLPFFVTSLILFGRAFCYYYLLVLSKKIIYKQNGHVFLLLLNILIPFFTTFLSGSRGDALNMIVSFAIYICFFYYKKTCWKKKVPFKVLFVVVPLSFLILFLFVTLKGLIGREQYVEGTFWDDVFIYLGAQIKNYDYYLSTNAYHSTLFGYSTFSGFYSLVSRYLGVVFENSIPQLPFLTYNGKTLGNVYTCFYSFYVDGGMWGIIILSFLFGSISQMLYKKAQHSANYNNYIWLVIYSYLGAHIFFSFFAERFFANLISANFFRQLVWFIIVNVFLVYSPNNYQSFYNYKTRLWRSH